jgi:hypothetical protein
MAAAAAPTSQPGGFAVSPDIGPVPAIYVPRPPGEISAKALVQHAVAGVARLVRGWAPGWREHIST